MAGLIRTAPLTAREVKNKILSQLDEASRRDAIVGETQYGGYVIITDVDVYEIYETGANVFARSANIVRDPGWEDYDY